MRAFAQASSRPGLIGLLIGLLATCGPALAAGPRVVSLNPCLDAILIQVADRDQILALSHYSRTPGQSTIVALARTYPFTWGGGEEIAALRPDLVLVGGAGPPGFMALLPRLHAQAAHFNVPETVEASLAQVAEVAARVGHPDRGAALVARIRKSLAAAAPAPGAPPIPALVFEGQGFVSGPGVLMDELMRRTGFANQARHYGLKRSGELPLEALVADPPAVLLSGRPEPGSTGGAERVLAHPALRVMRRRMFEAEFPAPLLYCGGPVIIPAVQALAAARLAYLRREQT